MIKATDLRIGNIVNTPMGELVIAEILKNAVSFAPYREAPWTQVPFELIKYIPITEERLLMFGFDKMDRDCFFQKELNDFMILIITLLANDEYLISIRCIISRTEIEGITAIKKDKYVHSLQNLIFALTETELTIKP